MEDLRKISSIQLYRFLKNLSIGLLLIVAMVALSRMLPSYISPVISLICAAVIYTILYNHRVQNDKGCMFVIYALFFCFVSYSFITIIINILYVWGVVTLPKEFVFFNDPYLPTLSLNPIFFVVLSAVYLRKRSLYICKDCRLQADESRGKLGNMLCRESNFQMRNMIILFGSLSVITWIYYKFYYINIDVNNRDWYILSWLNILAFIIDEIYFIFRYYNLYLDLKENNEIITQEELNDMTAKTYLRYYLICGNHIFMTKDAVDSESAYRKVIDTPFFTKRSVNGISIGEVKNIISRMSGVSNGDLRFFYGRKLRDLNRHSLLRYFYFLDGDISDYQNLKVDGEWMDFDEIKRIYSHNPGRMSRIAVTDITRLATIILTSKTFDENGYRKSKLKAYRPTFNLREVRNSELDFQDDKWIKISLFNSDTRLYKLKKWWRSRFGDDKTSQWR